LTRSEPGKRDSASGGNRGPTPRPGKGREDKVDKKKIRYRTTGKTRTIIPRSLHRGLWEVIPTLNPTMSSQVRDKKGADTGNCAGKGRQKGISR